MSDHDCALKPAPFWLDDPALWFAQTEAQFWYFKVKDDFTKFNYIIAQLDKHTLTVVKDVVLFPSTMNKYESLKSALLNRLKETKIKNIREILMAEDIGDRKPSEFLHHLKDLAGVEVEEQYIKSIWSSRLPEKIQWVSSFLPSSSLEKIAQLADLALNSPSMKPPNKSQATITDTKADAKEDVAMKELTKRVEDLTEKVEDLSTNKSEVVPISKATVCDSASKTASTLSMTSQTSMYNTKKRLPESLILCWYHTQFGWSATKCVQPCNFTLGWVSL